jgi:hypothetical protein
LSIKAAFIEVQAFLEITKYAILLSSNVTKNLGFISQYNKQDKILNLEFNQF